MDIKTNMRHITALLVEIRKYNVNIVSKWLAANGDIATSVSQKVGPPLSKENLHVHYKTSEGALSYLAPRRWQQIL